MLFFSSFCEGGKQESTNIDEEILVGIEQTKEKDKNTLVKDVQKAREEERKKWMENKQNSIGKEDEKAYVLIKETQKRLWMMQVRRITQNLKMILT